MNHIAPYFLISLMMSLRYKTQAFIWSLSDLLPTVVMFFYWITVFKSNADVGGMNRDTMLNYYFLSGILAVLVISHPEYSVSEDINKGRMNNYLVKPFVHWQLSLMGEIAYKISRAIFSLPGYLILVLWIFTNYGIKVSIHIDILTIIIIIASFTIIFLVKYITGLLAFFFTEIGWMIGLDEILTHFFTGILIPLSLYPSIIQRLLVYLPFKYYIYVPILALQGGLSQVVKYESILIQLVWILLLSIIAYIVWKKGIKIYSGYGQ